MGNKILKRSTPYMLNLQGDLIECEIGYHPYLLRATSSFPLIKQLERVIKNDPESLKWYYENTDSFKIRGLILDILYCLATKHKDEYTDPYGNYIIRLCEGLLNYDITKHNITSKGTIEDLFSVVNDKVNEEFTRVRTSHITMPDNSNQDIYFRISSKHTNWFDTIWNIVYNNRNWIDSVTIVTDKNSKGKEEFYKLGNLISDHMSVEDFINLKGNPIIESIYDNVKYRIY